MKTIIVCLVISCVFITGCTTNEKITEEKYSGFLNDYSNLRPDPKDADTLAYRTPNINWQKYTNVMVDKVTIITPEDQEQNKGDLLVAVSDRYRELIREKVSQKFNLVDKAASNTIRVQPAITGVSESFGDREFYQYLPIGIVVTGAARTSGLSKENVRVMTEIRVVDSLNGQILVKAIDLKAGKEKQDKDSEITLQDVEPVLEQWAQRMTNILNELRVKGHN